MNVYSTGYLRNNDSGCSLKCMHQKHASVSTRDSSNERIISHINFLLVSLLFVLLAACGDSARGADSADEVVDSTAVEQVVTIYFAGTLMDDTMWDPVDPLNSNAFTLPETVATLHYYQKVGQVYPNQQGEPFPNHQGKYHTKVMVEGMPAIVRPSLWNEKSQKAKEKVLPVAEKEECKGKCIILNLVGYSRGAVSTMHFVHRIFKGYDLEYAAIRDKIKKVNILAFDPVPGYQAMSKKYFTLPHGIEYLGIYAEDERTSLFEPVFPNQSISLDIANPPFDFFTVPGSHETLVGNTRRNGHRWNFFGSAFGYNEFDDWGLSRVSSALKRVASEILGSSDWGHVRFGEPVRTNPVEEEYYPYLNLHWYYGSKDINLHQETFNKGINQIYGHQDYKVMRSFSTLGVLLSSWYWNFGQGWRCYAAGLFWTQYNPRCVYFGQMGTVSGDEIGAANGALPHVTAAAPINTKDGDSGNYLIWDLIRERGSLDVDGDFVDYMDDNCPTAYNPDQVDVCNSCIDTDMDGYSDEATDNCPLVD